MSLSHIKTIWKVYNDGIDMLLSSSSLDKTKLILPPFSLTANLLYTIEITVIDTTNDNIVTSSVEVTVLSSSSLVAVIDGTTDINHIIGTSLVLNAGRSYDPDVHPNERSSTVSSSSSSSLLLL